jgi:hypothetical protein
MIQLGGKYCAIFSELGVPMKLVKLIRICLNETYSKVRIGKHFSDNFPIQNSLKQGEALAPLLFNFTLKDAITEVQKNPVGLKLSGRHQELFYADDVNLMAECIDTMKENIETLIGPSKICSRSKRREI